MSIDQQSLNNFFGSTESEHNDNSLNSNNEALSSSEISKRKVSYVHVEMNA